MKNRVFFDALETVDPAWIADAAPDREEKSRRSRKPFVFAACAAVLMLAALFLYPLFGRSRHGGVYGVLTLPVSAADVYIEDVNEGYADDPASAKYLFTRPTEKDLPFCGYWICKNHTYFAISLAQDGTACMYQITENNTYDEQWEGVFCFGESTLDVYLTGEELLCRFPYTVKDGDLELKDGDLTFSLEKSTEYPSAAVGGTYAFRFRQGVWAFYDADDPFTLEFLDGKLYYTPWENCFSERGERKIIPFAWDEASDTVTFADWQRNSRGTLRAKIADGILTVDSTDPASDREIRLEPFTDLRTAQWKSCRDNDIVGTWYLAEKQEYGEEWSAVLFREDGTYEVGGYDPTFGRHPEVYRGTYTCDGKTLIVKPEPDGPAYAGRGALWYLTLGADRCGGTFDMDPDGKKLTLHTHDEEQGRDITFTLER